MIRARALILVFAAVLGAGAAVNGVFMLADPANWYLAIPGARLAGHAILHIWEVSVGICGPDAISRDFPAVTLPALVAIPLAVWALQDARRSEARGAFS